MQKTMIAVLLSATAFSTAAMAEDSGSRQDRSERRGPMRQMMEEIRDKGINEERFAELTAGRAERRFDRLDADGDGTLSREEFTANLERRLERRFARLDSNEDGILTRADRRFRGDRHGRHEMHKERRGGKEHHGEDGRGADQD